jgi:preprotein translocase subunit YajC
MILAQEQTTGGFNPLLIMMIGLGVVMFIMMRSQKRKIAQQRDVQESAEVGDEIMTTSGIFGTIVDEDEDEGTVVVEIAPGTRIKMLRGGIARRVTEDDEDVDVEEEDAEASSADDDNAEGPFRS